MAVGDGMGGALEKILRLRLALRVFLGLGKTAPVVHGTQYHLSPLLTLFFARRLEAEFADG